MLDAYRDGTLDLAAHLTRYIPGSPPRPPFPRGLATSPRITIPLETLCDILRALRIPTHGRLTIQCAAAQGTIRRASPWRAVGWDRDPDYPPGAPSMAPWLVQRASATLVALPRLLTHADALTPADEAWALAQGLSALRLLSALGVGDTFQRLAPWLPHLDARNHARPTPDLPPCRSTPCLDPHCGLPLPECGALHTIPLDAYLHTVGPTLGADVDRRLRTWTGAPLDQLRAELYASFAEEAWTLANGGTFPFEYAWPPDLAVVMALCHYNRWPPPTTHPSQLASFLAAATPTAAHSAPRWPTLAQLEQHAHRAGFALHPGLVAH